MPPAAPTQAQITVLYDAFGKSSDMRKDWGYAALVEYGGADPIRHWQTIQTFLRTMHKSKASTFRSWILS
jgi:hypothetical protein